MSIGQPGILISCNAVHIQRPCWCASMKWIWACPLEIDMDLPTTWHWGGLVTFPLDAPALRKECLCLCCIAHGSPAMHRSHPNAKHHQRKRYCMVAKNAKSTSSIKNALFTPSYLSSQPQGVDCAKASGIFQAEKRVPMADMREDDWW